MGLWLKWAWRYGVLTVENYDSLDAALGAKWYAQDDEAFGCIEGPDGVVPADVVEADNHRRIAEERATETAGPKRTHGVQLAHPSNDRWAWWDTYLSEAEAEAAAADLRDVYGDRVKVKRLRGA